MRGNEVRGIHIAPNNMGLGHNARLREVSDAIVGYLGLRGKEPEIIVMTEASVIGFWEGFPTYRLPSKHDNTWLGEEQLAVLNGSQIDSLLRTVQPDYVAMDVIPRRIPREPPEGTFKAIVMRPINLWRYLERSKLDEESWGGFDFVGIATHSGYENLLDFDEDWQGYFEGVEKRGGRVEHVGRVVSFRKDLDEIREDKGIRKRIREKLGYDGEFIVCLAYGGGGLLSPERSGYLEDTISSLESSGVRFHMIAGPYSDWSWVKHLRDAYPNLDVEPHMSPEAYAKRLVASDLVVSPSSYNTQTMCFYLEAPLVSVFTKGDECQRNWVRSMDEMGATKYIENVSDLPDTLKSISSGDCRLMADRGRRLLEEDGAAGFARGLVEYADLA